MPNFIFLDYNMPKVTGGELLKKIRGNEKLNRTVITVLSTSMDKTLASTLIADGANYAIEKPYSIQAFTATLRGILNDIHL